MPEYLNDIVEQLTDELREMNERERSGRTYVGPGATAEAVAEVSARRKSVGEWRTASPGGGAAQMKGVEFLRDVKRARSGDPDAYRRLLATKTMVEGTDSAGGFLISPDVMPSYLAARRAGAPILDRLSTFNVTSNEVTLVVEGTAVQIAYTPEAAAKLETTAAVSQVVSTVHKLAGVSTLSDELLADSHGNAEKIVSRGFAQAIDAKVNQSIYVGSGAGQPTGLVNVAGIEKVALTSTAGQAIYEATTEAVSRIAQRFYIANTVAMNPAFANRIMLSKSSSGSYLFASLTGLFGPNVQVVLDPNIPLDVGDGKSAVFVGDFSQVYYFVRQAPTLDVSNHVGFIEDTTTYRAVHRYGAACVQKDAFSIITELA